MIIRFARRKAAWESNSIAEIRDVEFKTKDGKYDFRPSVYLINISELVRAYAEHAAAAPIELPASALGIEVAITLELCLEPGSSKFEFIKQQHREIKIEKASELDEIIDTVLRNRDKRLHEVKKLDVVRGRARVSRRALAAAPGDRQPGADPVRLLHARRASPRPIAELCAGLLSPTDLPAAR